MFRRIDQSRRLGRFIEWLSTTMAKRRGLPVVLGVLLIAIGFVARLAYIASPSQALDIVWVLTLHVGLILAFVGLLLVEPLGK